MELIVTAPLSSALLVKSHSRHALRPCTNYRRFLGVHRGRQYQQNQHLILRNCFSERAVTVLVNTVPAAV